MRIRSLEISGFKSFPDRVVLSFPPGICAIVGPNGCGKSNIVDAIRWVMGEQNPRHLRGRMMEDLIFSGTETKPGVGMVEVILTLDNSDGAAPPAYNAFGEIEICRRLYRGGESEYRINKVPCRLRDIVDFFLDTGVGTRGYTIVEQGHIVDIVSTRPEDRRFIIEEAAGIGKYRQRRRETERKLEATEQNLVRVNDILGELRRQIGMLERQSRKAHRHRELAAQLREVELSLAREELDAQEAELSASRRELQELRERSGAADEALAGLETRAGGARDRRTRLEDGLRGIGERLSGLRSEIQGLEGRIQYERREREELLGLAERRGGEIEDLRRQLEQNSQEASAVRRDRAELESRLASDEQEVARRRGELESLASVLAELQGRREGLAQRLLDLSTQAATLDSRAEAFGERRRELERRLRAHDQELEAVAAELDQARQDEAGIESSLAELLAERESLGRELAGLLGRRTRSSEERAEQQQALDGVRRSHESLAARLESLEEAEREAARHTRGIIERIVDPDRQRIRGLLADVLEVEDGYERAVEAALEARLYALVVDRAEDALALIDQLRSSGRGRVTALSVMPSDEEREGGFVPLGRPLLDLVRTKPPHQGLVARVLRGVHVVEDLREAVERYGVARPPAVFVTPGGDILDEGGAITGGTQLPLGAMSRATEIQRLRAEIVALTERRGALESAARTALAREQDLEREIENTRSRYHSAELAVVQHEKDLERVRERGKQGSESREVSLAGKGRVLAEIERVESEGGAVRQRAQEIAREREGVDRELGGITDEIADRSRDVEREERSLVERQIALASLRERRDQLEAARRRTESARADAEEWLRRRDEEVRAARERVRAFDEGTAEATAALTSALAEEERLRVLQEESRRTFEATQRELENLEAELRRCAREREECRERIAAQELRAQERRLTVERTAERVREVYGVDLSTYQVPEDAQSRSSEERRAEIEELRRRLDSLGPVYHGAIEEYEEVSERSRYLTEQKADIEASVERLRNAIARINRTSRARFRETFERVDAEFRRTFPRLFRGGRAYLALTEGEDVLEAGIEIVAQPPGKKLQNLNLLSGGEKSLTALALLFAVFNVKPSPFFLLDEVDAALDDVNVGRFDELMREIATHSQFVLITHNKSTIEIADTLYGVTMEQPGASKVVSVALVS